jgi:predicted phage terminase large subunit-like protein
MLPTEFEPARTVTTSIGWADPRKARGELLWADRFGPEEVKDARVRLAARGFSAQHQQNPSQEEGAIFKREKFKHYMNDPRRIVDQMDEVIQSWDMAFKDLETSSKVAGHVWGRKGADRFLLDRVCEHLDFVASIAAVEAMTEKWPTAKAKLIEDKANGPAVIASLARKVQGLIPWPPKGQAMGSKIARAFAAQPEIEAGNVWLPDPQAHPWVPEFVEYCVAFPGGEYDDDIDAMTQALEKLGKGPTVQGMSEDILTRGERESYWKRVG